jgi:type IV pilus assembly protein PilY1
LPGGVGAPFLAALAILAGLVLAGIWFPAVGAGAPVTTPPINLSSDPLYAMGAKDKPAMALALSVEFPTVGAQYVNLPKSDTDNSYANTRQYLGYYDSESCYRYNDAPRETVDSGKTAADYKRFDPIGKATSRKCKDAFSGNFLNWVSNSAVDMLRLALSGGDRYIDTPTLTVLQRAVIPNGDPICMWNSTNFPAKRLARNGGGAGSYWGAVPDSMKADAGADDIWVANTLNRIYFRAGSNPTGSCKDTSGYRLGGPPMGQGPVGTVKSKRPPDTVLCSAEDDMCEFSGVREVWFGVPDGDTWTVSNASNGIHCSSEVMGAPPPAGASRSCYTRSYQKGWKPPPSAPAINSDGFFYSRVQVCNKSKDLLQDVRDFDLCMQYPSGFYKPVGVIQNYSDQLRLAAFGYLMDQTASEAGGRYGGVLRAPMKYVGQKNFDAMGREETAPNARAEWDADTGVFKKNPESDKVFGVSGVVNYLNQFGRTGPVPGRYKKFDPVGELYYQSLRYMQGLAPTPDAISGLGTPTPGNEFYDGYPVYTDWTQIDPYGGARQPSENYACMSSNIVVIGDVNTHDGNWRNIPASDDPANNATNFRTWHQVVQAFEKKQSMAYPDGQGTVRTTSNPNAANPSVPSSTLRSQIMGYAYWAHTHDIRGVRWTAAPAKQRPGLRVKTFVFDVNEFAVQNDPSKRRYANQFFMAAKYGGFNATATSSTGLADPYNSYGNPFRDEATDSNDNNVWQKENAPGEASTYYLQSDARGVLSAFQDMFQATVGSARSIAGSAAASRVQASAGNVLYSAKFDVGAWTGDVIAEQVTRTGTGESAGLSIPSRVVWSAAARLRVKNAADRRIFAGHGSTQAATEFTWSAINGKPMQLSLSRASPSAPVDSLGPARLDYLRGVRTNEGTGARFRVRKEMLGDIVNSGVTWSGPPVSAFTGNSYGLFMARNGKRAPVVFAGANDGMLHAFAAQTNTAKGITAGDELFAYIPSWMGPKLSALTSPGYSANHQAYVDAPSAVAEAQVAFTAGNGSRTDWKTVLVSGTGGGGAGCFRARCLRTRNLHCRQRHVGVHGDRRSGHGVRGRASADSEVPHGCQHLPLVRRRGEWRRQLLQHVRQWRGQRASGALPARAGQARGQPLGRGEQLLQADLPGRSGVGGDPGDGDGEFHAALRTRRRGEPDLCRRSARQGVETGLHVRRRRECRHVLPGIRLQGHHRLECGPPEQLRRGRRSLSLLHRRRRFRPCAAHHFGAATLRGPCRERQGNLLRPDRNRQIPRERRPDKHPAAERLCPLRRRHAHDGLYGAGGRRVRAEPHDRGHGGYGSENRPSRQLHMGPAHERRRHHPAGRLVPGSPDVRRAVGQRFQGSRGRVGDVQHDHSGRFEHCRRVQCRARLRAPVHRGRPPRQGLDDGVQGGPAGELRRRR